MKKLLYFVALIILAPLIAGVYGILHDQLTYTLSPEYYTRFKFFQFGFAIEGTEAIFPYPRIQVSWVGFLATWWVGLYLGLVLSLIGLRHKPAKRMFRLVLWAIFITMGVALLTGGLGWFYGKFYLVRQSLNWWFPKGLQDKQNFIAVGSMHNFSYLGGLIGLVFGTVFLLKQTANPINPN